MKRSTIQKQIKWAKALLLEHHISLPCFGYWTLSEWKEAQRDIIEQTMLGWDVTDFGNGMFDSLGAVLFTLRNGVVSRPEIGTPYAEKLIVLKPGQRLPIHMHKTKSEDIISRAGEGFLIKLWNAKEDDTPDQTSRVEVYCDGIKKTVEPGEIVRIENGNSITLPPRLFHSFWAPADGAPAVIGEVSSVNDDNTDNYFAEKVNRFATIEEDEELLYPLCNEYHTL